MTFVRFVRFVSPHANLNLLACSPAYPCHLLAVINRAEIAAAAAAAGGREPAGGKEAAVQERLRRLRLVVEQVGALVMAGDGPPSRCLPSAWSAVVGWLRPRVRRDRPPVFSASRPSTPLLIVCEDHV